MTALDQGLSLARAVANVSLSSTAAQAYARRTDPETSREAAASVADLRPKQRAVYAVLAYCGNSTDQQLVDEYAHHVKRGPLNVPPQSESGIRTRRAELVAAGLVRDTGQRTILGSRRRAIRWEVVA